MLRRGKWIPQPSMIEGRILAAASVTKEGEMWVTGGKNSNDEFLSSSEVFRNGKWEEGPPLPVSSISNHCMVSSKDGVIVAGKKKM